MFEVLYALLIWHFRGKYLSVVQSTYNVQPLVPVPHLAFPVLLQSLPWFFSFSFLPGSLTASLHFA